MGLGFGASWGFGSAMGTEEMLTVTFQNSSRFEGALPDRREAGRPLTSFEADVFGTRQE